MWFGMISNQITKFQIKSKSNHTFSKSNHYSSNQIIMCDSIMILIKSWFGFANHCYSRCISTARRYLFRWPDCHCSKFTAIHSIQLTSLALLNRLSPTFTSMTSSGGFNVLCSLCLYARSAVSAVLVCLVVLFVFSCFIVFISKYVMNNE